LVEHSDLPGFSQQEQSALALLVRNHRRKLHLKALEQLPHNAGFTKQTLLTLTLILRLATVLNRARSGAKVLLTAFRVEPDRCSLAFQADWLDKNPLVALSLQEEAAFLSAANITLETQ
jgi:exopolyphosphatase/guanosine-5'-triphosphate,3'-diphosphate pyrophosphatase